jgi:hypothetical protein
MITDYKIVVGSSIAKAEAAVKELLKQGYEPHGSLFCEFLEVEGEFVDRQKFFLQAMVLRAVNEKSQGV